MPAKQLLFGADAHREILAGVKTLTDAVRVTLGPKARTVVLEKSFGAPTIINSGVIVAREIELEDPFENMGAQMVKEVASKTSDVAGDGTTTATPLASGIMIEGMKYVSAGHEPHGPEARHRHGRRGRGSATAARPCWRTSPS